MRRRWYLGGGAAAALFFAMSFSYNFCNGTQDNIDFPRFLTADTVDTGHAFEDSEITGMYRMLTAQWQTGQFYAGTSGSNLPSSPVAYLRVAAYLLNSLAASPARLAGAVQILDVKMDLKANSEALAERAKSWLEIDDDAGAFAIIEQVNNEWSFIDRFWKTVQRQAGL